MTLATTDLSDAHPEVAVCEPIFHDFGARRAFHGPIKTLNSFIKGRTKAGPTIHHTTFEENIRKPTERANATPTRVPLVSG